MMYLPLWLNLTSEIEEMISEKNDRLLGSSGSSKTAEEEGQAPASATGAPGQGPGVPRSQGGSAWALGPLLGLTQTRKCVLRTSLAQLKLLCF